MRRLEQKLGEPEFYRNRLRHCVAIVAIACCSMSNSMALQLADNAATTDATVTDEVNSDRSIPDLADAVKKSLVVVRAAGRDGQNVGLATGFVISEDGLIATARHCIEEGHDIRIETQDGTLLPVTQIYCQLEARDLVVLKIESKQPLIPLTLGNSDNISDGESVVAVGHPQGLRNTVFSGIIAGSEEIDGMPFIKLSMKIERGSSGEPVVDRQGNVIALVTLKSTARDSVGFGVPVNDLKQLLEDPAPISIERWKTIGALDAGQWQIVFGANWRQRAGRIVVDGYGTSFGGRSLCLQQASPTDTHFELQVEVKLDDESGAAGLAFHSDGTDRHYGFYPSNGSMRVTRFSGPDLDSWTILHSEPHSSYRPNEWNTLKVRATENRFEFFVNEQQVFTTVDDRLPPGRIGLTTFRGTSAEFRRFRIGEKIPSAKPSAEQTALIESVVANVRAIRPAKKSDIDSLRPLSQFSSNALETRARQLEQRAIQLRRLAADVHSANIREQILLALRIPSGSDAEISSDQPDLLRACLLVAALDNEEIEADPYIQIVDRMAEEIRTTFDSTASEAERIQKLDSMLFQEMGYHGAGFDYNTRSSSYLNEVIDDREGLPITMSVLYMELAKRLQLKVVGVGLPGHFVVRFEPTTEAAATETIDVFNKGKRLDAADINRLVASRGYAMRSEFQDAQQPQQIIQRMVINLLALAEASREDDRVLRYLNLLVAMDADDFECRAKRMEIRARTGRLTEAIEDIDWFISQPDEVVVKDVIRELRADLEKKIEVQNAER